MKLFKKLFTFYLMMIAIFFLGRSVLFGIYFDRFSVDNVNYWLSFLYGLRMDTILSGYILVIPTLLLTISPPILRRPIDLFLTYYFLAILSLLIFMEVATLSFFAEYDVRPNYLFLEYLVYPKEILSMLWANYKLPLFVAVGVILVFTMGYLKFFKGAFLPVFKMTYVKRMLWTVPLAFILFMGIRSSVGHRPANICDAMYSTNRIVNEITKNSLYSVACAFYSNQKNEMKNISRLYGRMDLTEAIKRFQTRFNIHSDSETYYLSRREKSHFKSDSPKNLVIFLQESLGYQFVEVVGGEPGITPNLNRLASEGILFTNLYSNGTRSVRGIAGVAAGNFSVPGRGVVKRNKSQSDYFTLAKLLKPMGYYTSFIYGGESRFDNMKGWFLGNGFDQIIDESKFKSPSFVGTWGVSDGDVVIRANEEFKKHFAQHHKFASVIFSTSNHKPFDFPMEKIELIKGVPAKSAKNAIKYADYAIGEFIKLARKEPYYNDTVIVIVADHNIRVYGDDIVPINMFHIPALIVGGNISPTVYNDIASQPDVLATLIDLIGIDGPFPVMGHSIFSDKKQNLTLMQFNDRYALMNENKVAVIRPRKGISTFIYQNKHLKPTAADILLEKDVLASVLVLNHLYQNRLYR